MQRHPIPPSAARWGVLLVGAILAACDSPTAPEALTVTARTVSFASDAERSAWPFTPTVQGGQRVVIRGMALITCASPIGTATRREDLVEVHIAGDPVTTTCPANVGGWQPVEATVVGLRPGNYRVRVTAVGHIGRAEWVVSVIS